MQSMRIPCTSQFSYGCESSCQSYKFCLCLNRVRCLNRNDFECTVFAESKKASSSVSLNKITNATKKDRYY